MIARRGRIVVIGNRGNDGNQPARRDGKGGIDHRHASAEYDSRKKPSASRRRSPPGLENGTLNPIVGREFPLS